MPTLLDVLARHQIYLEGLKKSDEANFHVVLSSVETEVRRLLAGLTVASLDRLTKLQLNRLMLLLHKRQLVYWDAYQSRLLKFLRDFMQADLQVSKQLFNDVIGHDELTADAKREHNSLYGIAALRNNDRLWAIVRGQPLPAAGVLPVDLITGFTASSMLAVENLIRKGYANSWTIEQALNEIIGTKRASFKDGSIVRFTAQAETITGTIIQHVSATVQAALASLYFPTYRWVSVIDGVTTPICRSRNGRIYRYVDGPQPPAHFHCRSKTVPITNDATAPPDNFLVWVTAQPVSVQNDALGLAKAKQLREGKLKAAQAPKFDNPQAITLAQFQQRVPRMLTDA